MAEITKELGRIPVSRGDYQATIEYYKDNIVQYKRGSYQVISESPIIGIPPTNDKNIVNPGWTLFAGTLDAQDVVNQIKEQEIKSIQAVAAREAEILAKSDAAEVSSITNGLKGNNVQANLNDASNKLSKLENTLGFDKRIEVDVPSLQYRSGYIDGGDNHQYKYSTSINTTYSVCLVPLNGSDKVSVIGGEEDSMVAFVVDDSDPTADSPINTQGYVDILSNEEKILDVPQGCSYLIFNRYYIRVFRSPSSITLITEGNPEFATKQDFEGLASELTDVENEVFTKTEMSIENPLPTGEMANPAASEFEDLNQNLPIGAILTKVKVRAMATAGTNDVLVKIYTDKNVLDKTINCGVVGTEDLVFDLTSYHIEVKQGYHYTVRFAPVRYDTSVTGRYRARISDGEWVDENGYWHGFAFDCTTEGKTSKIEELKSKDIDLQSQINGKQPTLTPSTELGKINGKSFKYGSSIVVDPVSDEFMLALTKEDIRDVENNYAIYYSNGEKTSSSGKTLYIIPNRGYSKIKCYLDWRPSTLCAIAFYKSDDINAEYYDAVNSVKPLGGAGNYEKDIPADCKLICVVSVDDSDTINLYSSSLNVLTKQINKDNSEKDFLLGNSTDIVSLNNPLLTRQRLTQLKHVGGVKESGVNPLVIVHFSDIHGGNTYTRYLINKTILQRIIDYKNYYSEYIDDILCTGDVCYNQYSDRLPDGETPNWWDLVDGSQNIMVVLGNHDTSTDGTEIADVPQTDVNNAFIEPYYSNWGVVKPSGKNYYYKDYTSQGIRLIVIDPYYSDADELSWFDNVLNTTNAVIVAMHPPFNQSTLIDCTFNALSNNGTFAQHIPYQDYVDKVSNFIANDGEFICWLHGHVHRDVTSFYTANVSDKTIKQLVVGVTSAKAPRSSTTASESDNSDIRILDTKSMDSFNIIGFEKKYHTLTIMRVGSDNDVALRHRGICAIDYKTCKVLFND